jgi:hypothetical protein
MRLAAGHKALTPLTFLELTIEPRNTPWVGESGDEMWDEFSHGFGPIVTLLRILPPEKAAGLKSDVIALFEESAAGQGNGLMLDRPYILVRGVRRK